MSKIYSLPAAVPAVSGQSKYLTDTTVYQYVSPEEYAEMSATAAAWLAGYAITTIVSTETEPSQYTVSQFERSLYHAVHQAT